MKKFLNFRMAFPALGFSQGTHLIPQPLIYCIRKVPRRNSVSAVELVPEQAGFHLPLTTSRKGGAGSSDNSEAPEWKKLNSKELGITMSMISEPTIAVLSGLRKKGFNVYLVGGCVRDLILKRTPKDFDVITSAELKAVLGTFPRSELVGKRFPICHVHIDDTVVEVSSFSTLGRTVHRVKHVKRPPGCNERDYLLWRNCLQRDFTINGLMFDPYKGTVYDYIGGLIDIGKAKVRTVIPASLSFSEDCARILRAFRVAARLGFSFTKEVARSVRELSDSVLRLDKGRILMEMNYMLAFGSSEASLRLLWRFGLLELLLPIQASYFVSQGFRRRDERSNMLLSLFSNLDKLVAPDRPCHSSLWIGILAFHKALADKPRDPVVVVAFILAIRSSGSLVEAVHVARGVSKPHDSSFQELLELRAQYTDSWLIDEIVDLAESTKDALSKMTDRYFVSRAMSKYPQAPSSHLVFISVALSDKVCNIFQCVGRDRLGGVLKRGNKKIDYEALAYGRLHEVRRTFAKIVLDTVYPARLKRQKRME